MGSKSIISNAYLEDIGDAIRQKRGTEETYYPSQMGDAIRGIEGIVPSGTINIDTDGTYDVTQYAEAVVETGIEELRQEYESAVEISGCDPLSEGLETLLTDANTTTGNADTTLSDAVGTLISGYGGYLLDDIASGTEPSGDIVINSNEIVAYFAIANRKITSIYAPHAKSVGLSGFNTCTSLLDVKLPVCEILGGASFQSCSKLKNIEVPSLIKVSQSAFMTCIALTSIYLPLVETIETQSFRACINLTELKLPSCSSITGANIFTSDTKLTDIYLPNDASTYTGAPWGAPNATIHYNTVFDENGEPII